ncbi:universal stress protein [Streptomyces sp. HNM0574]|uniref:universal stress protein n=1 Tax=Streptomyces sp. HNM0574 TaxID=2714954 RepID=UPI00146DB1D2|nr:universal stress protein [Streptomyces sp. HNM0574]NLU69221.1 universal stress protein [Streptomyces sp. HNM0574]
MADTSNSVQPPVVVGADGSQSGLEAVEAAARVAHSRRCRLHVVHAFTWPLMHVPLGPSAVGPSEGGLQNLAEQTVSEAVARARETEPDVLVTDEIVTGEPLTVLAGQSEHAELVVVGSRGLGGFTGLLLGSVAVHLSAHGHCPVLVVRGRQEPTGPVLLGVDGSPDGSAAVGFAFAEASHRGVDLVALHTWNDWTGPVSSGPGDMMPLVYDTDMLRDEEERVLAQAVAGWHELYPDVTVHRRLERSFTRTALIDGSEEAQLVVLGARGRGGFTGLLLGSVSQALLHHAHCPVAVVRGSLSKVPATAGGGR